MMKIIDKRENPSVLLMELFFGDLFKTMDGNLWMKTTMTTPRGNTAFENPICVRIPEGDCKDFDPSTTYVIPVQAELHLTK